MAYDPEHPPYLPDDYVYPEAVTPRGAIVRVIGRYDYEDRIVWQIGLVKPPGPPVHNARTIECDMGWFDVGGAQIHRDDPASTSAYIVAPYATTFRFDGTPVPARDVRLEAIYVFQWEDDFGKALGGPDTCTLTEEYVPVDPAEPERVVLRRPATRQTGRDDGRLGSPWRALRSGPTSQRQAGGATYR